METQYGSLREKIRAENTARKARYAKFAEVYKKAYAAGMAAAEAAVPTPMVVTEEVPATGRSWYVPEGACGFAWITIKPATCSFAKWLVKTKRGHKGGRYQIWIAEHGQSVERKEAHACAMAEVLRSELGIEAYAGSRLD